jgi:hypothetical protein
MQSRHNFKTLENDVFMNVTSQVSRIDDQEMGQY